MANTITYTDQGQQSIDEAREASIKRMRQRKEVEEVQRAKIRRQSDAIAVAAQFVEEYLAQNQALPSLNKLKKHYAKLEEGQVQLRDAVWRFDTVPDEHSTSHVVHKEQKYTVAIAIEQARARGVLSSRARELQELIRKANMP